MEIQMGLDQILRGGLGGVFAFVVMKLFSLRRDRQKLHDRIREALLRGFDVGRTFERISGSEEHLDQADGDRKLSAWMEYEGVRAETDGDHPTVGLRYEISKPVVRRPKRSL